MADTIESVLQQSLLVLLIESNLLKSFLRDYGSLSSKFSGARQVVGETGKEVLLRRTLAYGTKYGIYVLGCFV